MTDPIPEALGVIAGKGAYPRILAESARQQGVKRLFAVAFEKETDPVINEVADEVCWLKIGQLKALLTAFAESGVNQVVMAGQITPTHLFRIRPDQEMLQLLTGLKTRNADTIFGAIGDRLRGVGVELAPASLFMEAAMPAPGLLGRRAPTESEQQDIELGVRVAKATSELNVGQTVVVREGTILAVEAFEGTDETIKRAGRLSGEGAVVVKVARRGHDMRFDIPVVGRRTFKVLKKAKASVLAVEAHRAILLEREALVAEADRLGICFLALDMEGQEANE